MKSNNSKKIFKVLKSERNEGLEPMQLGNFIAGFDSEIHEEDVIEHTYKLPLGAVKRLIRSYYDDIESIDSEGVYLCSSGSWGLRMWPYCHKMLNNIIEQLNKHGLKGKEIFDEVF